jgi:hypothetical protein
MVNPVGSLEIIGTIDVANIKHGLSQVKSGLESAKESAKSAFGDMEGLMSTLSGIGLKLVGIGVAASAAIIGLASMGPAVAPSMARMQVSMFEVTRTLSEALAPAFEKFADLMEGFSAWLQGPQGQAILEGMNEIFEGGAEYIESFSETFSLGMGQIFKSLSGGKSDVDGFAATWKFLTDVLATSGYIIEWIFINAAIGLSGIIAFFQHAGYAFEEAIIGIQLGVANFEKATAEFFGQPVSDTLVKSIEEAEQRLRQIKHERAIIDYGLWTGIHESKQHMGEKWDALTDRIRSPVPVGNTGPSAYNSEHEWNKEMNDANNFQNKWS